MRFLLPDSYLDFFLTHGILEIEAPLAQETLTHLKEDCLKHLKENLLGKPIEIASSNELWKAGRNHWSKAADVKKNLQKMQLGNLCHGLFQQKPIRLAYSQLIAPSTKDTALFNAPRTLQEISALSPLLGGALLILEAPEIEEPSETPNLLQAKQGHLFFISKDYSLPLPQLLSKANHLYLLLAFAPQKMRYCLESNDPLAHELKKQGLVFGDTPSEEICPYLYR